MQKTELLVPVGSMESLKAAIIAECDAVYLGGKSFGARNYATNFSNEEIVEAIEYAHIYGVKVYVTVNTLIFEDEIEAFMNYIDFLHLNNVDAIIIQDLGMLDLVRQTYPNLEIHASTQMHIHNIEGVKLAHKLGVNRIVLAREIDINEIKKIKEELNIDLEVFIHGALCISYSGQCLMSYFLGGRSGNRGTCAQCCRMPYDLIYNDKKINDFNYLLSTKDLSTLENIGSLIDIGVDSLKIEGRMKRPEYVYIVTKLYREAIDSYIAHGKVKIDSKKLKILTKIFNRNFTKGFLFNENNNDIINQFRPNHIGIKVGKVISNNRGFIEIKLNDIINQGDGIRILNNSQDIGLTLNKIYLNKKLVNSAKKQEIISLKINTCAKKGDIVVKTTDKLDLEEIDKKIGENYQKIKIDMKVNCLIGKKLELEITDSYNKVKVISNYKCEQAVNNITTKDLIIKQLNRLKNTAYILNNIEINRDDNVFINTYELNEIRRQAINLLNQKRCYKIKYEKKIYNRKVKIYDDDKKLNVFIKEKDIFKLDDLRVNKIYTAFESKNTVLKLPRIMNKFPKLNRELLVGELGSVNKYSNFVTDFSLNVTNSYTVALLNNLGSKLITLSYENTDNNIKNLIENYKKRYGCNPNLELIISSYPEVMISKFNLLKQFGINNKAYLKSKKNHKYKIEANNNFMTIYNYEKIVRNDYKKYYKMGIKALRIELNDNDDLKMLKEVSNYLKK